MEKRTKSGQIITGSFTYRKEGENIHARRGFWSVRKGQDYKEIFAKLCSFLGIVSWEFAEPTPTKNIRGKDSEGATYLIKYKQY